MRTLLIFVIFIPFIASTPLPQRGVELSPTESLPADALSQMSLDAGRMNMPYCHWQHVESVEGVYDWTCDDDAQTFLSAFRNAGIEPTLILQGCPAWACETPCELPQQHFPAFIDYVVAAVEHYGLQRVEIWNEANSDGCYVNEYGGHYYGGWGNDAGAQYANLLGAVRQATDAEIWVSVINPEGDTTFIEDMLAECNRLNSPCFDVLGSHRYAFWWPHYGDDWVWTWSVVDEANVIRWTLEQHGFNRPVWLTETALLYPETSDCDNGDYWNVEAKYADWLGSQSALDGIIYFGLWDKDGPYDSWYCTGMTWSGDMLPVAKTWGGVVPPQSYPGDL